MDCQNFGEDLWFLSCEVFNLLKQEGTSSKAVRIISSLNTNFAVIAISSSGIAASDPHLEHKSCLWHEQKCRTSTSDYMMCLSALICFLSILPRITALISELYLISLSRPHFLKWSALQEANLPHLGDWVIGICLGQFSSFFHCLITFLSYFLSSLQLSESIQEAHLAINIERGSLMLLCHKSYIIQPTLCGIIVSKHIGLISIPFLTLWTLDPHIFTKQM